MIGERPGSPAGAFVLCKDEPDAGDLFLVPCTEFWLADPYVHTVEVLVLEEGAYRSLGVFEGAAILPSRVVPDLTLRVEQFFED